MQQTERGAAVRVVIGDGRDPASIEARLGQVLRTVGLADPVVTVEAVETIERLPSGKLRRFVPLSTT